MKIKIIITRTIDAEHYIADALRNDAGEIETMTDERATELIKEAYKTGFIDALDLLDDAMWKVEIQSEN